MTKSSVLGAWGSLDSLPAGLQRLWLALPLASLLLMQGTAWADDAAAGLPKNYFNLASQYDSLSFSLGPLQTFESPDPKRYRDLTVAMHDGKVRLGELHKYSAASGTQPQDRMQAYAQGPAMQHVYRRLTAEREVYLGLLALQYGADYFTPENLLQDNPDARSNRFMQMGNFVPRGYVGALAYNVYQEPYFKTAFCREAPSCWDPANRPLQRMGIGPTGNLASRWGGGLDEFAARTAVEAFIAKDLQPLLGWSRALPTEVALVGSVQFTEYDFSRGGFVFHISMPRGSRSPNDIGYAYFEAADAEVKVIGRSQNISSAFWPVAAGAAEALIEELKAAPGNDVLYFALEGRLINVALNEPDLRNYTFTLMYELVSADVTLYKDQALTQPLGTVKLQVPQL